MEKYIKKFSTTSAYNTYMNSNDKVLPNISLCMDNNTVAYNPWIGITAKFNVTSTSLGTVLCHYSGEFSKMWIDGVEQENVVLMYTFNTTGEHTVKYELIDPTTIGDTVFLGCSDLISITIPNTVTSIGLSTFSICSNLNSINLGNNVTSIGASAFTASGLSSITIPASVTSIGSRAFYHCSNLTSITCLGTTAPTIAANTFENSENGGTLYVPAGSDYSVWMGASNYYLGKYNWTKVEE